jgi:hypothetical protein
VTRNPNLDGDRGAKARAAALEARGKQVEARAAELAPIIAELQAAGVTSLYGIAKALNARSVPTATGKGQWVIPQVRRVAGTAQGVSTACYGGQPWSNDHAQPTMTTPGRDSAIPRS